MAEHHRQVHHAVDTAVAADDLVPHAGERAGVGGVGGQVDGGPPARCGPRRLGPDVLVLRAAADPYDVCVVLPYEVLAEQHAEVARAADEHIDAVAAQHGLSGRWGGVHRKELAAQPLAAAAGKRVRAAVGGQGEDLVGDERFTVGQVDRADAPVRLFLGQAADQTVQARLHRVGGRGAARVERAGGQEGEPESLLVPGEGQRLEDAEHAPDLRALRTDLRLGAVGGGRGRESHDDVVEVAQDGEFVTHLFGG
ncbi:hypothetical protein RB199_00040 [Streptomyces libani]